MALPFIPETITVHLGQPDEPAENIQVSFVDYIKNVASSEIYPTWPEAAIRANILAQITFALNRIYTEFYRSQGYDFDITSSTRYDQAFVKDRGYFENIARIVDDIFNNYIVKQGSVEPYFTQYCDGKTVMCSGLSQWGTVELAREGYIPYEILQNYYGEDINIVFNAPIKENIESYPGRPFQLGNFGDDVLTIQRELNRISDNYPQIPKITEENGFFDIETENAVKIFQQIFNLDQDGIVGKATWYKIKFIYNTVKKLSEISSEGLTESEIAELYKNELQSGDIGDLIRVVQYYLSIIAYYDDNIPLVNVDGIYDQNTEDAVIAFQSEYGLPQTGIVNQNTWNRIRDVYDYTLENISEKYLPEIGKIFPGRFLSIGIKGDDVKALQGFLKTIYDRDGTIPNVEVTGEFDQNTQDAVKIIQMQINLPVNGVVGPLTWDAIVEMSEGKQE